MVITSVSAAQAVSSAKARNAASERTPMFSARRWIRSVGVDPAPRLGVAIGDALRQGRKETTGPPKPAGPLHT